MSLAIARSDASIRLSCLQCPRQTQLLELTTQESKLVAEEPCKFGVSRSEEDLSRSTDGKLAKMVEKRQHVDIVDVCDGIVEQQHWGA
jgi:hypothetical protein